jgi:hypothetical protein
MVITKDMNGHIHVHSPDADMHGKAQIKQFLDVIAAQTGVKVEGLGEAKSGDVCYYCTPPAQIGDGEKELAEHLVVTQDTHNHIHVHGPLEKKTIMEEMVDAICQHAEIDNPNIKTGLEKVPAVVSKGKVPDQIVFKNRQAIGDILTMTAGIRDFKKAFPNTEVGIITTAMHIWDHNPNVNLALKDPDKILEVGPGHLTNKSNRSDLHMCNAFRVDIENKLGVSIPQGDIRPDIWMTEEEYNRPPLIEGPYWIIVVGGEPGWPVKMYPEERWQEVVDSLPNIQFVQIGVSKHPWPHLKNVIDYIGKTEDRDTGLRDLFNLFLNAQGSLGLVSMHMHLSAAFQNPCVTGDTLVATGDGLQMPTQLIDKKFAALVHGNLYNDSKGFWKTGTKKLLQLQFKSGRQLEVTPNHKIMTEKGWKAAEDIVLGERVKLHNHRAYDFEIDSNSRDYARGYCIGHFLGDGCIDKTSVRMLWCGEDKYEYLEDGLKLLDQAGWALSRRYRAKPNKTSAIQCINLYDFAVEKGCIVNGKKKFTRQTLIGSWSYLAGLVAGYFDADGTVGNYTNSNYNASISSVDVESLRLLQLALSAFGIDSNIYIETKVRINTFANKQTYNCKPVSRLVITGESLDTFASVIPIRNKEKKNRLNAVIGGRTRAAKVTKFFDCVVQINKLEAQDVYDCEVGEIHAFDADSIYVHNCVVVAGAREPMHFTHYMGHQYLQTNGCLPCAETSACWKCKVEGCTDVQKRHGMEPKEKIPPCVDLIQAQEVVAAVKKYYEGGRLEYGKKIKNKFFKNIVKEANVHQVPKTAVIDNAPAKQFGMEWGGGSITDRDWDFLKKVAEKYEVKTLLEFGAGLSTLLFSDIVESSITYETHDGWIKKIKEMSADNSEIRKWDGLKVEEELPQFDMCFVDGPAGGGTREFSTKIASEHAKIIVVHDAGRAPEKMWQEKYLKQNFQFASKGGHRCHLWVKPGLEATHIPTAVTISEERANKPPALKVTPAETTNMEKSDVTLVSTARGWGGCARSITTIMRFLLERGKKVNFVPFHGLERIGSEFATCLNTMLKDVKVCDYNAITQPTGVMFVYADDFIWEFPKPQYQEVFSKVQADKKIMMLNYRRGKVGEVDWTKGWDRYAFLNTSQEQELLKVHPEAEGKTKVLPPCTDLTEFLKAQPDYNGLLKLIRHSSQGNTKFAKKDDKNPKEFKDEVTDIIAVRKDVQFHFMPGPDAVKADGQYIIKYPRNNPPVYEFLGLGNCFWYSLPIGYMDMGPRVILEAMAAGLPVIADNWGGAKDRVTPECGWLCDTKEQHIEVIKGISTKDLAEKGAASRQRAIDEFIPERWIDFVLETV